MPHETDLPEEWAEELAAHERRRAVVVVSAYDHLEWQDHVRALESLREETEP